MGSNVHLHSLYVHVSVCTVHVSVCTEYVSEIAYKFIKGILCKFQYSISCFI